MRLSATKDVVLVLFKSQFIVNPPDEPVIRQHSGRRQQRREEADTNGLRSAPCSLCIEFENKSSTVTIARSSSTTSLRAALDRLPEASLWSAESPGPR